MGFDKESGRETGRSFGILKECKVVDFRYAGCGITF